MIECYFDDSADQRREMYYACGGLLGSDEQWDSFEMAWSDQTHKLKEPFRTIECECGHGQFSSWSISERNSLMSRLVGIIHDCNLYGYASIVPIQAYKKAFSDNEEHDAYFLAVTQVIMNMAYIGNKLREDVCLWFELGPTNTAIKSIYNSIRGLKWSPARRLRSIHIESKRVRPLQSADLVAREAFKHSANLGIRSTRIPVRRLAAGLHFTRWNSAALEYLAQNGGPENLELLASWDTDSTAPRLESFWKNL